MATEESPASVSQRGDRAAREIAVPPPARGSIFRIAEFPPGIGAEVPAIHRTRSLDYVVVQQGTNHAWINHGASTCRLGMVFIDAEEPDWAK